MKKIPISEASFQQLHYHATTILGLEVARVGVSKAQVIAKIHQAAPGTTEITVAETPDSPAQEAAVARTAAAKAMEPPPAEKVEAQRASLHGMSPRQAAAHHNDPQIDVMIPQTPEPGGDRDVPVSVNGVQFLMKRDTWVTVPYRIFEALRNAVQTVYTPKQDDIGRLSVDARNAFSYPFNTRNEPSEEEIEEWRSRTMNVELA